ncbi:uncharacterized protein LOC130590505 [Beta vulgaris subsp. vulgaris]|uniref:uncharacterized protein LOC130590505 n=1 Tax=Beta vulgaris subsp. vulgaris TaxID=3555 RepID=UPI0025477EC6|nr:uncharacterized protein LOC130590505 [Beta vulgaris subsp. vulgaris]
MLLIFQICNRLKQAGLAEVFEAKVDGKVGTPTKLKKSRSRGQDKPVSCLRLLKKFSPKLFQQKVPDCEYDNLVSEQTITSGNLVLNTEQLVELSLKQQIVDMIDGEASKGLLGVEVGTKTSLSLNNVLEWILNRVIFEDEPNKANIKLKPVAKPMKYHTDQSIQANPKMKIVAKPIDYHPNTNELDVRQAAHVLPSGAADEPSN